jgi:hypothetical protein
MAGVNLVLYFQFVFKIQNLRESKGRRSFCEKWSALRQHPPGRYEHSINLIIPIKTAIQERFLQQI